ncbi:hypothetical protein AGMMS49545_20660 [Betaproteobacteria bacterium]|nr:hypothetical protein AGMMS49545_20660 [Betaproteobacteria bacterium]GHU39777.1 hypothetical protein AGMMS50289_00080 [Betaproteobacteria bacterium]
MFRRQRVEPADDDGKAGALFRRVLCLSQILDQGLQAGCVEGDGLAREATVVKADFQCGVFGVGEGREKKRAEEQGE